MEMPITEWKSRLRGMDVDALMKTWSERADDEVSWNSEINFHVAAAERMKQLGNMAIDLDDATRKKLQRQAEHILSRLERNLSDNPEHLAEVQEIVSHSEAYYAKYGRPTARHYMYEQGVIDLLGDRIAG